MPCGSRDRRRIGHRCLRCRNDHTKCDGCRPCSSCSARGVICVSKPPPTDTIIIIEYKNKRPARRAGGVIKQPLVHNSWRYISVFFQAIGPSAPPIISVFSFNSIGGLSHEDSLVYRTVSVVGGVYASRNSNLLCLSGAEKSQLFASWVSVKQTIEEEMQGARKAQVTVLLCALLAGFVELLLGRRGKTWRALIRKTGEYIRRHSGSLEGEGTFESALVRFLRISDITGAILMCEDVAFPMAPYVYTELTETDSAANEAPMYSTTCLDSLLNTLEEWALLQDRALSWAAEAEYQGFPQTSTGRSSQTGRIPARRGDCVSSRHLTTGIEVICQAARLQRKIIASILPVAEQNPEHLDPALLSILPYYYWGLTCLSRLFIHPAWSALNCELPVMSEDTSRKQAIAALKHTEGRLSRSELGAVLYMPILHMIGVEMKATKERKRVLELLSIIKNKGFEVAAASELDLQAAWMRTEKAKQEERP